MKPILERMSDMRIWGSTPDEMRKSQRLFAHEQHNVRVRAAATQVTQRPTLRCGFCGRPKHRVKKLIQGPPPHVICDECVDVCVHLLNKETK